MIRFEKNKKNNEFSKILWKMIRMISFYQKKKESIKNSY